MCKSERGKKDNGQTVSSGVFGKLNFEIMFAEMNVNISTWAVSMLLSGGINEHSFSNATHQEHSWLFIFCVCVPQSVKCKRKYYLCTWIKALLTVWCCCCCCCRWAAVWGGMGQVSGTLLPAHHRPRDVAGRWATLPGRQRSPGQHCHAGGAALCQWWASFFCLSSEVQTKHQESITAVFRRLPSMSISEFVQQTPHCWHLIRDSSYSHKCIYLASSHVIYSHYDICYMLDKNYHKVQQKKQDNKADWI